MKFGNLNNTNVEVHIKDVMSDRQPMGGDAQLAAHNL